LGHEVVAYIAADNLTPTTKRRVAVLLGGRSLASVSSWADQVRMFGRPETAPWHFIDIPVRGPITIEDVPRFCPGHDCVVDQIEVAVATLKDGSGDRTGRVEALKFLAHFVGDLHQPLHCADDHDRGGNDKIVRYRQGPRGRGRKIKLHAFWDHLAEADAKADARDLATKLRLTHEQRDALARGSTIDWTWEGHAIARDVVYPGAADGEVLSESYVTRARTIVFEQLRRAGARLASILNRTLGQS
jgi:hypothetical protein